MASFFHVLFFMNLKFSYLKIRLTSAKIKIFESLVLKILAKKKQVRDMFCCARKMLQLTQDEFTK